MPADDVRPTDNVLFRCEGVHYLPQKRNYSCWYACAKMLYGFKAQTTKGIKHVIQNSQAGQDVEKMKLKSQKLGEPGDNLGASSEEWPIIAEAFGFGTVPESQIGHVGADFEALKHLLEEHNAPLWCAGRLYGDPTRKTEGHVVVLTGVLIRSVMRKEVNHVIVHDPAPPNQGGGKDYVRQFDSYFKSNGPSKNGLYTWAETEGVSPIMYKL